MGHMRKMRPHSNNQASEDTYLAAQRGTSGQASALYPPSNAKEHYAHALGHRACAEVSGGTIGEAEHLAHDTGIDRNCRSNIFLTFQWQSSVKPVNI